ncbi:uncharacterized protein LOC110986593 isoform X2 [Acanthaster planci]|uniref:Uncharacterized protein LOC110986593 isoform X2 n=1 Tax=Acanthaster planci TaxID=133434 RepID=A0A8B7ZGY6_ACAPL|nr:uncharacterized protein LOC110986593 isoform X2 [Acanthaster planci]
MSRLRKSRMTPSQQACEACRKKEDSDGFEVRYIDDYIGHGTFVTKDFAKGDFLLQYRGEVISQSEGESRQESYPVEKGSFLYFFQDKGNSLCVDGTNSDGACRMVNDAPLKKSNSQMKVISVDGTPCLCLFAREDIAAGQELRYDYGDESVPWRQKNIDHQSFDHEFPERWASQLQQLKTSAKQKHVGQVAFSRQLAIAEGCNGSKIYLGFFGEKQLPVAVKRVNSDHVGKEVEILQSLQGKHLTNVLQTFCVEHDEDFTYLASELCEMNIQEVVEATLPFADKHRTDEGRKKLCLGFLNGLQELHSLGIVHRDIKPANALIDTKGDVKIADFGVSRRMMGQTTLFTQSIGTICWMAIESLQGEMVKYKKSSDIQMTGCLVYYILSDGHIPHETAIPYTKEPEGVVRNLKAGTFHLEHLGSFLYMQPLIREMVSSEEKDRPSIEFCLEKFQDLSKQTLQVSSTKGTSLVASLLTSKEQRKVKQLARETACAYTRDFDSFTTHVVIPTDDNQLAKERSLKFLQGIAARVWIISFKWITESLERGQMLPEKDFEVKGDTVMGKTHGPERARLWQAEALLHTHVAYVLGASAKLPKDCVLTLLKMCGATTVDSSSKLTSVSQNLIRVVIDCVHDTDYPFDSAIKDLSTKYEVPIVTKEWLLDSIGSYTIQPFQKYQLEDEISGNTASFGRTSTLEELDLSEKEAYSENLGIDCEISVSGSDMISSQASDKVGASSDICSDSESEYEPSGTSSDESEESCPQSPKRICKREEEGVTLSSERGTQEMGGDHVRYWKRNPPHQNRGCDSAGEETVPASNIVSTDHADKESNGSVCIRCNYNKVYILPLLWYQTKKNLAPL